MSTADSTTPVEQTTNAEVIAGLREVADFLEQHPGLPSFNGFVHGHIYSPDAREKLSKFAATLGSAATERVSYKDVIIAREFAGGVDLELRASAKDLGAREVEIDYEPILPPRLVDWTEES